MSAFYRVMKHLREHPGEAVPADLKADVEEIKRRCEAQQRRGIEVHLSSYMLSLLGLEKDPTK